MTELHRADPWCPGHTETCTLRLRQCPLPVTAQSFISTWVPPDLSVGTPANPGVSRGSAHINLLGFQGVSLLLWCSAPLTEARRLTLRSNIVRVNMNGGAVTPDVRDVGEENVWGIRAPIRSKFFFTTLCNDLCTGHRGTWLSKSSVRYGNGS